MEQRDAASSDEEPDRVVGKDGKSYPAVIAKTWQDPATAMRDLAGGERSPPETVVGKDGRPTNAQACLSEIATVIQLRAQLQEEEPRATLES